MTNTAPAYENVPVEIDIALTIEEAAQRAGMTVPYFRTLMGKLNGTEDDLRTPVQPGVRARKYDINKVDAWKAAGTPIRKEAIRVPQAKPGARQIEATATRQGTRWIVDLPEIGQGTQTENLRNAERMAHTLAVTKLGVALDEVAINLTYTLPETASTKWQQSKDREREAKDIAAQAARLKAETVHDLRDQGYTFQDIGEMLSMSPQRAQQLSQENL
ncbi:hypothetical protein IWX65_002697 [Arthrobacter sp. CAN_A214]|uniref:hypothetical protein n=1 Tax=Arthrobacter sp. CAN_A214 TaxID=2787720 RepID=UPI0018CB6269